MENAVVDGSPSGGRKASGRSTTHVRPSSENRLRLATKAAGVSMWSWNVDTDELSLDEDAYALWGLPEGEAVCFEDLSAHVPPLDRDRVRAAFAATRAILGAY